MTLLDEGLQEGEGGEGQGENSRGEYEQPESSGDGKIDDDDTEGDEEGDERVGARRLNHGNSSDQRLDPQTMTANTGIYNQFYAHDHAAISMSSLSSQGGAVGGSSMEGAASGLLGSDTLLEDTTVTSAYALEERSLSAVTGGGTSVSSVTSRLLDGATSVSTCYTEAPTRASSLDVPDTPEHHHYQHHQQQQQLIQQHHHSTNSDPSRRRGHLRKDSKSASLWI